MGSCASDDVRRLPEAGLQGHRLRAHYRLVSLSVRDAASAGDSLRFLVQCWSGSGENLSAVITMPLIQRSACWKVRYTNDKLMRE